MLRARLQYANGSFASKIVEWIRSACWPTKTVLFFPDAPPFGSVVFTLCALLGYAITTDPRKKFDVGFKWKDTTVFDPTVLQAIQAGKGRIVNAQSLDISKRTLGKVFQDVFGYALDVDPSLHHGPMVEKSDRNSAHDGRILNGPLSSNEIRPRCVYQKLIDNSSDKVGLILDHRLPVNGNEIPFVYLKYRPVAVRFSSKNTFVELKEPSVEFSQTELVNVLTLARRMGIDYGEFDVLRDQDGRIYVVDTNNTPFWPPVGLTPLNCKIASERLASSFDRFLEEWPLETSRGSEGAERAEPVAK